MPSVKAVAESPAFLDPELYELCVMEGVSAFWTFRNVTLPLLIPTIIFLGVRDVAWSFQSTFVPSLVITEGGPEFATLFLPLYIYQNGFEYLRFGYASAMTVAMFILTALLVGAQVALLERWGTRQSERLEPHPLHSPGGDTITHESPR